MVGRICNQQSMVDLVGLHVWSAAPLPVHLAVAVLEAGVARQTKVQTEHRTIWVGRLLLGVGPDGAATNVKVPRYVDQTDVHGEAIQPYTRPQVLQTLAVPLVVVPSHNWQFGFSCAQHARRAVRQATRRAVRQAARRAVRQAARRAVRQAGRQWAMWSGLVDAHMFALGRLGRLGRPVWFELLGPGRLGRLGRLGRYGSPSQYQRRVGWACWRGRAGSALQGRIHHVVVVVLIVMPGLIQPVQHVQIVQHLHHGPSVHVLCMNMLWHNWRIWPVCTCIDLCLVDQGYDACLRQRE